MKYGDEVKLQFVDANDTVQYIEPLVLQETYSYRDLDQWFDDFKVGAKSALNDVVCDIKSAETIKDIPDSALVEALINRGYTVLRNSKCKR